MPPGHGGFGRAGTMPIPVFVEPVDTRDERREAGERPVFCGLDHPRATPGIKHPGESSYLRSGGLPFAVENPNDEPKCLMD